MTNAPTLVAVSPHLDDVALSASGTLAMWQGPRLIVTVFSGDAPSQLTTAALEFLTECRLGSDAMARRRSEDRAGSAILGAECHHLDLPEALFRELSPGIAAVRAETELFEHDVLREESSVVDEIVNALARMIDGLGAFVTLAPLAIGQHRDHVLVRSAVESLVTPWGYYGDQPYCAWDRPGAAEPDGPYLRRDIDLQPDLWEQKVRAVSCYRSQMVMLWGPSWADAEEDSQWRAELSREYLWTRP